MFLSFQGIRPHIAEGVFVAPGAWITGKVSIGKSSSVWFNTVIRGDAIHIHIGDNTNIQDNVAVHGEKDMPTTIGNRVTIAHNAVIHGCTIGDDAVIGIGAIVLNGAQVGQGTVIGAGAIVTEGSVIPPYSLAVGAPAKVVRELREDEKIRFGKLHEIYRERAQLYLREPGPDEAQEYIP
ncbi:MAG: gamma carbonic anhydrase family protein [Bacillota bacterium]